MSVRFTAVVSILVGIFATSSGSASEDKAAVWIGTWEHISTVNYSTCTGVDVGDVHVSQLILSITKGQVIGVEMQEGMKISFAGVPRGTMLLLASPKMSAQVGIEVRPDGSGRRVVTRTELIKSTSLLGNASMGSCVIIYDLKATKK